MKQTAALLLVLVFIQSWYSMNFAGLVQQEQPQAKLVESFGKKELVLAPFVAPASESAGSLLAGKHESTPFQLINKELAAATTQSFFEINRLQAIRHFSGSSSVPVYLHYRTLRL